MIYFPEYFLEPDYCPSDFVREFILALDAPALFMRPEASAASRWGWGLGLGALSLCGFLMLGAAVRKRYEHPEVRAILVS